METLESVAREAATIPVSELWHANVARKEAEAAASNVVAITARVPSRNSGAQGGGSAREG
jgi:hypothetical protein